MNNMSSKEFSFAMFSMETRQKFLWDKIVVAKVWCLCLSCFCYSMTDVCFCLYICIFEEYIIKHIWYIFKSFDKAKWVSTQKGGFGSIPWHAFSFHGSTNISIMYINIIFGNISLLFKVFYLWKLITRTTDKLHLSIWS